MHTAAYRTALLLPPDHVETRLNLSALLLEQEELEEAERVLREGIAASPDDIRLHRSLVAVLDARDDDAASRAELERWLARTPDDVEGWHDLAHPHFDSGMHEEAIG